MKRVKDLSDEDLQMIIAKDQGFTEVDPWLDGRRCFELRGKPSHIGYEFDDIPNYPRDLNAMREVERSQNSKPSFWQPYWQQLRFAVERTRDPRLTSDVDVGCAEARQRAEAYVIVRKLALP